MSHKPAQRQKNKIGNDYLKLQLSALIIYVFVFIIFAFIGLTADISIKNIYYLSLVMFSVSSFVTGFFCALKKRKNGLQCGVLGALPVNCIITLVSVILNGFSADVRLIITFVLLIFSSALGGIVSVNIKLKK